MSDPSYNQPDPFANAVPPTPIAQGPVRSRRRPWLPVVGAIVLALVAFAGGFAVANATSTKTTTGGNGVANDGNGQGFGPGASGRPRGGAGGFGGGASGTVGSVAADQMTITTASGGQRIVLLTPTTTVTQVTSATKAVADIAAGQTVTVVGTANPDGSVTATRIVIGDVSLFGGRGGNGGPGGSAAPGASAAPSSAP
ncbi:MAG TPA: DUF5666 domain-containing protein [Candidatus Bathyarchaeia archaeon]|nr:DUF5666 domain-containing protein [Candidatus Bathyarchaeia archaeon]